MIEIRQEHAEKVLELVGHGLVSGVGEPIPGRMCVEAAVCFALGLPHGDDPGCVTPSLRRLKIRLNDSKWSSNLARAEGLKRLAVAQLGSLGAIDDAEFQRRVIEMTIRKAVPIGLRAAATLNPDHAEALVAAAVRCEHEGTRDAALNGERIARTAANAATAYAYAATAYAADATAYAYAATAYAADATASSADAASSAAYADASTAAYADASAAASAYAAASAAAAAASSADAASSAARARDRVLAQYADWVVEILVNMQAPGCRWLSLIPA